MPCIAAVADNSKACLSDPPNCQTYVRNYLERLGLDSFTLEVRSQAQLALHIRLHLAPVAPSVWQSKGPTRTGLQEHMRAAGSAKL